MTVSDTSALVLNWTSSDIWKSDNARNYFSGLDLGSADRLLQTFDDAENHINTQIVSNRKFFVRKSVIEFLEKCERHNITGQVIILAAGIDALSVEIASLYPKSRVFDVDKYLMDEKEKYTNNICPNIHFIECDITNIELLNKKLAENGWDRYQPSILLLEGITYYLSETGLRNILSFFSNTDTCLVCDFGLKPEYVSEPNRRFGEDFCRRTETAIGFGSVKCYKPDYFMHLLKESGFKNCNRIKMDHIQKERTGAKTPFEYDEPIWVTLVSDL